jgi:hypothetical protein
VATAPPPDTALDPINGDPLTAEDWVTTFHLVMVAVDPFTYESAWLIDTAGRILSNFVGADCRVSWLVAGDDDQAREFLGPWSEKLLTFADPDREMIGALGLETLPAIVHLDHSLDVVAAAEGWDPTAWREVVANLTEMMSWNQPTIPEASDPMPYAGTPAIP